MDLLERIDYWGRTDPERIAHRSGGRLLTYGELRRRSDALARRLAGMLPDDGRPVAILGHKEPEMLIGFLGAVKAGHPYIPLDRSLPADRLERTLAVSGAGTPLTPESIARWSDPDAAADGPAGGGPAWPEPAPRRVGPGDPYYIIFTSGSTGEPKGVTITLGNLTGFVDWLLSTVRIDGGRTWLNQATFSFDLSVMDLYPCLTTGGTLVSVTHAEIANPRELYALLGRSDAAVWVSTPSFAQLCLAERSFGREMMPGLSYLLFCGETLAPEVVRLLLERFPGAEVWNTYGPTETTVATTAVRVDRSLLDRYSPLPVGFVRPDAAVLVMDFAAGVRAGAEAGSGFGAGAGRPVPDGTKGEIVIAGPNVSPGYLARPDLTGRSFVLLDGQRAYRTGDWGHFEDGMLFFDGRIDGQVKVHGYRIELGDVEANLRRLPEVRDAVVVPVMKSGRADSLAAYVMLTERPAGLSDFALSQRLKGLLGAHLPDYMLPRKILFVDAFPMTPGGKADRRKLAEALS